MISCHIGARVEVSDCHPDVEAYCRSDRLGGAQRYISDSCYARRCLISSHFVVSRFTTSWRDSCALFISRVMFSSVWGCFPRIALFVAFARCDTTVYQAPRDAKLLVRVDEVVGLLVYLCSIFLLSFLGIA